MTTPFHVIRNVTTKGKWLRVDELGVVVGYQMKLAGINWRSHDDLAKIMWEMCNIGFLEYNVENPYQLRVKECFYDVTV